MNTTLHSTLEHHVKDAICPQCKRRAQGDWRSEFWETFHYVTKTCPHCQYQLFVKAVPSSGVDH